MAELMTPRERWIASLSKKPMDRLPFWPKINGSYAQHQDEPYRSMSSTELHKWIGSDQHVGIPSCVKVRRKNTSIRSQRKNGYNKIEYITPLGTLNAANRFDQSSSSWHPVEFPVKKREDINIMREFFADAECEFDEGQYEKASAVVKNTGESAVITTGIGVSPLMDWVQHLAGIENAHYMLWDYREDVESLFEQMHSYMCRRAEITADKCPADAVYSVENTSTTLISPEHFQRYCYNHLMDYGNIITSSGKFHILHMCGHLKDVLPYINELPASAIEAFTSPPVGNTTLKDGKNNCNRKCLIGGTNAALWIKSKDEIFWQIKHDLDELENQKGIVVTSAGVMPPLCKPETIKAVAELVKNYNISMDQ
ncbi:hypothetical protein GF312_08255 [Candidatus Poribacteria bacterium]|nr:hypothetical protein [Candidatus Poribacteria bacterium]